MPLPLAPDTAKVSLQWTQYGQELVNVFHFRKTGGYTTEAALTQLLLDVSNAWATNMLQTQVGDVTGVLITCTDISQVSGPGVEAIDPEQGIYPGGGMPTNVTWTVKWTTGRTGRSYRGRTYHIGLGYGMVANDDVIEATALAILGHYQDFLDDMTAAGDDMVVVSNYSNGVQRTTAVVTPVTGVSYADLHLDSQRRRLAGRGT